MAEEKRITFYDNYLNFNPPQTNNFSFPEKLIIFVNQAANARVMHKLYCSCKYFYIKNPYFIIDDFVQGDIERRINNGKTHKGHIGYQKLQYQQNHRHRNNQLKIKEVENIWVTQKLWLRYYCEEDRLLLNKIVRCDTDEIMIDDFFGLSWEKFIILTKSGNAKYFECNSVLNENGKEEMFLEDILNFLPNSEILCLKDIKVSLNSMNKLLATANPQRRKKKFRRLKLLNLNGLLDVDSYYEFLIKNGSEDLEISTTFQSYNSTRKFEKAFNEKIDKSKMNKKLPKLFERDYRYWEIEESLNPITFNNRNIQLQDFPFRLSLMEYIFEKIIGKIMRKLHRTCKYFYQKFPYCIVNDIDVNRSYSEINLMENDAVFPMETSNIGKMWITNLIIFDNKRMFKKIYRCEAQKIVLGKKIELSMNELEVLTKYGFVKEWDSFNDDIFEENGELISLRNLFLHLSNSESIRAKIREDPITEQNLVSLNNKNNKLKLLELQILDGLFDANLFYEILECILASEACVSLTYVGLFDETMLMEFQSQMEEKINKWKTPNENPLFIITNDNSFDFD